MIWLAHETVHLCGIHSASVFPKSLEPVGRQLRVADGVTPPCNFNYRPLKRKLTSSAGLRLIQRAQCWDLSIDSFVGFFFAIKHSLWWVATMMEKFNQRGSNMCGVDRAGIQCFRVQVPVSASWRSETARGVDAVMQWPSLTTGNI
jgi:hypothetical protein